MSLGFSDTNFSAELDRWVGDNSVYWSAERKAWIVTGYEEADRVLKDAKSFWRDAPQREGVTEFWGRHLMNLVDADHRRMHAVHMRLTSEKFAEKIRPRAHEISLGLSSELVAEGKAELSENYADVIPLLVGCDYLGLDISDKNFIDELIAQMQIRAKWKEALHAGDGISLESKIARDGQAAVKAIFSMIMPVIRDRRDSPREDLISALWQEGPTVFPDWNEDDVMNTCWSSMDNEGKPFLRGLLCILCNNEELQKRLRDNPILVKDFVEEGLRFLSPFRTLIRIAKDDVQLGGEKIGCGDKVYVITSLANRDEKKWSCPYSFDIDRTQEVTHFTFGYGSCYCVGRYVGRVEATEAVTGILAATSSIRLDPDKAKPEWFGEVYHAASPINVIFQK